MQSHEERRADVERRLQELEAKVQELSQPKPVTPKPGRPAKTEAKD